MLDWKKIVREKLGRLPLQEGRENEVIEELAQQLESAYDEALTSGATETEAMRVSLGQFRDWRKLRNELFQSVEGATLPVWEQNGPFAPRRLPVWIALAAALAFLALPAFREALQVLPLPVQRGAWRTGEFSAEALQRLEHTGDKQKYVRTLAYVALHSPDDQQAAPAAEKAIALDPQLTWISAHVSHANHLMPDHDPKLWIDRLKVWDPDNAYVYLLEGASVHGLWEDRWQKYNVFNGDLRRALLAEPRWRIPMEKAFAAPRMDLYTDRQFLLDREVLLERGLDRPDELVMDSFSSPVPDLFSVKMYADYLLLDLGENEEKAGHLEKALAAYQSVALFGERLQAGSSDVERYHGRKLRSEAYKKIGPLFRHEGRAAEAANLEATMAALKAMDASESPWNDRAPKSPASRSAQIVRISGLFLLLSAIVTAAWIACVALLRVKPDLSRMMNWTASHLGGAILMLLISALGLFMSFFPYSRSIAEYSTKEELFRTYVPFFAAAQRPPLNPIFDLWIEHMFWPLVWCAVVLITGAVCLRWIAWRRNTNQSGVE